MLAALERGFTKFDIDFYLIGATARNLWMETINDLAPRRTTNDIDFAILINKEGDYEALREYLMQQENFTGTKDNSFALRWQESIQVDLMPFGNIAKEDKIKIEGTGLTTLHVPGFQEVYETALVEAEWQNNQHFKFCTIPGIVLLKLLAWHDRPEKRSSDIQDICDILLNYFEMFTDNIYENHHDLFEEGEADSYYFLKISSRVLGREMGEIARKNPRLVHRILLIFEGSTQNKDDSPIADLMTVFFRNALNDENNLVEKNISLLLSMKQGIEETIAP